MISGDLKLWDLKTREITESLHPLNHLSSVRYSPRGNCIVVKNTRGQIVVIDKAGGEITDFKNRNDREGAPALFSPCGNYIIDGSWGGKVPGRVSVSPSQRFQL